MSSHLDPSTIADLAAFAAEDRWPRARDTLGTATFRASADDFHVVEELGFAPDGDGEFALLKVGKIGRNTVDVAQELARAARLPARAVGWAGRKDKWARAEQWFCVHLPGRDGPAWDTVQGEGWSVMEAHRHRRKLRVGALSGNRFSIVLRDCAIDPDAMAERIEVIAAEGVPNYFGPQRFGRGGGNLVSALGGRRLRRNAQAMALSAARSALFNLVLARRVSSGSWDRVLGGEVLMLRSSQSVFGPESPDEGPQAALAHRAASGEIDPTGPLWGRGELRTHGPTAGVEQTAIASQPELAAFVEAAGMRQERRRLRLVPQDLACVAIDPDAWRLSFRLEAGAFATSVVREIVAV